MKLKIKFDKKFFIIASACLVFIAGGVTTTVILLNRKTDEPFVEEEQNQEDTEIEYSEDEGRGSLDEEEIENIEEGSTQAKNSKKPTNKTSSQEEKVSNSDSSSSDNQQKSQDKQEQSKPDEKPQQKQEEKPAEVCYYIKTYGNATPKQLAEAEPEVHKALQDYLLIISNVEENIAYLEKNIKEHPTWYTQEKIDAKYAQQQAVRDRAYNNYAAVLNPRIAYYENLKSQCK